MVGGVCRAGGVGIRAGSGQRPAGAAGGEWRSYGSDTGSTKYAALDQIDAANVADLRVAWRWRTRGVGYWSDAPSRDRRVFLVSGEQLVALDAASRPAHRGAPMTYVADGKQYVVVAVSERDHEGELVAFALP